MKKYIALSCFLIPTIFSSGQLPFATILMDFNDTKVPISNCGTIIWGDSITHYRVPKDGKPFEHTLFASSLWVGGVSDDSTPHVSAMTYGQTGTDFRPGPKSSAPQFSSDSYNQILLFTEEDRQSFNRALSLYGKVESPPPAYLNYPGNGDTTVGEPWHLAPFIDQNKNGVYEPKLGDHPEMTFDGGAMSYTLYSDQVVHSNSSGNPLLIDVHQFISQSYSTSNSPDRHYLFGRFVIVNRSNQTYKNFRVGFFNDFEIGHHGDDRVGTDTLLQMVYAYNGADFEELGYEDAPPAFGMTVLNRPLINSYVFHNNRNVYNGTPDHPSHYFNYLYSRSKSGQFDSLDNKPRLFAYAGDPYKSEGDLQNYPQDSRIIAITGDSVFRPGDHYCVTVAWVFARSMIDRMESFKLLREQTESLRTEYINGKYRANYGPCRFPGTPLIVNRSTAEKPIVYPNPSNKFIHIPDDWVINEVRVLDPLSRKMHVKISSGLIDLTGLENGWYFIRYRSKCVKIIKHH